MTSSPCSHLIVPDSGVSPKRFWLSRSSCSLPAPSAIRPKCQSMLARLLSPRCTISGSLSFSPSFDAALEIGEAALVAPHRADGADPSKGVRRHVFGAERPGLCKSFAGERQTLVLEPGDPEAVRRATRTKAFVRDGGSRRRAQRHLWRAGSPNRSRPVTQHSCATMVSASAATSSWPEASATSCAS